jgi:hypothetical protein
MLRHMHACTHCQEWFTCCTGATASDMCMLWAALVPLLYSHSATCISSTVQYVTAPHVTAACTKHVCIVARTAIVMCCIWQTKQGGPLYPVHKAAGRSAPFAVRSLHMACVGHHNCNLCTSHHRDPCFCAVHESHCECLQAVHVRFAHVQACTCMLRCTLQRQNY